MSLYPMNLRVQLVREAQPAGPRPTLSDPASAARLLFEVVERDGLDDGREHFGVLCLTTRHRLIGCHVISVGCLTASLVHPREVFRVAILASAAALVLWHTHPSGDPEPSAEDLSLTRRLAAAASLMGIEILDHVVLGVGTGCHVSLKERGAF